MDHFFNATRPRRIFAIVRAAERMRFPERQDNPIPGFFFEVLTFGAVNKNMEAYFAEFPKRENAVANPHQHDGAEFIHVLEGRLAVNYESEDHFLSAGDSVYFDASEVHSYSGHSEEPARAIVVTSKQRV